jgi:hypothetical protein
MITQAEFDVEYITSREICQILGVTRTSLLAARKRKVIPDGIFVCDTMIWCRSEVMPYILRWQQGIKKTKEQRGMV